MAELRDQLLALVREGAIVTVRFPDGYALPPWGVAWLSLSEDERELEYYLCGGDRPHRARVARTKGRFPDDDQLVIWTEGVPDEPSTQHELTFETNWTDRQVEQLERWRKRGERVPAGAQSYAAV